MFNFGYATKLGDLIKAVVGLVPLSNGAGTRNGSAIDRCIAGGAAFKGMTLQATTGAATGGPASYTVDSKLQDSADGLGGWNDYVPPGQATVAKVPQITADNTLSEVDIDLAGAKRFVRVVEVTAFVGGAGPAVPAGHTCLLYGADRTPV